MKIPEHLRKKYFIKDTPFWTFLASLVPVLALLIQVTLRPWASQQQIMTTAFSTLVLLILALLLEEFRLSKLQKKFRDDVLNLERPRDLHVLAGAILNESSDGHSVRNFLRSFDPRTLILYTSFLQASREMETSFRMRNRGRLEEEFFQRGSHGNLDNTH